MPFIVSVTINSIMLSAVMLNVVAHIAVHTQTFAIITEWEFTKLLVVFAPLDNYFCKFSFSFLHFGLLQLLVFGLTAVLDNVYAILVFDLLV